MVALNPSGQRLIVEREIVKVGYSVAVYMPNAYGHAVGEGTVGAVRQITAVLGAGLAGGVFTSKDLREANMKIAEQSQDAIIRGWRARLPLKSGPYRRGSNPNKDRLSGTLGKALASSQMTAGTTDRGISFLNTTVLSQRARHWYRVNYGAYGHNVPAIRRPKAFPVNMDGHNIATLQDENDPAANSWLPRRFTFYGNEFFPITGPAHLEGGGHRAAMFTDLGYKALSENFGPVYRQMVFKKFRSGGMADRYQAKGLNVKAIVKINQAG